MGEKLKGLVAAAVAAAVLYGSLGAQAAESFCATHDLPRSVVTASLAEPMAYAPATTAGRQVLLATGEIKRGEAGRLAAAIHAAPGVEEVWFHSPGGNAVEGLEMGRVIRKAGLGTRLRQGQACISACSMAFLGGTVRMVEPGGFYGVHMFTSSHNAELVLKMAAEMGKLQRLRASARRSGIDPASIDAVVAETVGRYFALWEQSAARVAAARARYLVEMSTSLELMTDEFDQSADGVCYLGEAGLRRYNVMNARAVSIPAAPVPAAPVPAPSPPHPEAEAAARP